MMVERVSPNFSIPKEGFGLREGTAISPLDGRYWSIVGEVGRFLSEEALTRARVGIEARYLIALSEIGVLHRVISDSETEELLHVHEKITPEVFDDVKKVEKSTRHDLAATTQTMGDLLKDSSLADVVKHGWVHWGLTSEDANNLAIACLLNGARREVYLPKLGDLLLVLADYTKKHKDVVYVGKTHVQPAVPTTIGKEIGVRSIRLAEQAEILRDMPLRGKLTGAVGNLNALKAARPDIDWRKFSDEFVSSLGLEPNPFTTQIEPHDRMIDFFGHMIHANNILIDLSQTVRLMTGDEVFAQEVVTSEVGSSTMAQKVNPIDFENADGNASVANALLDFFNRYLPVSWHQRNLTDSTVQRNIGAAMAHSLLAIDSTKKGMGRIYPNIEGIQRQLHKDGGIISEAFQVILRKYGIGNAYDQLKDLTRGRHISASDIATWINSLSVDEAIKEELRGITPETYIGYAPQLALEMSEKITQVAETL